MYLTLLELATVQNTAVALTHSKVLIPDLCDPIPIDVFGKNKTENVSSAWKPKNLFGLQSLHFNSLLVFSFSPLEIGLATVKTTSYKMVDFLSLC